MKREYTPDRWILIQLEHNDEKITKILAGWHGGYLDGDSWRLSSGVIKIEDHDKHYIMHNESGSVYYCWKNNEGVTGLSGGILNGWMEKSGVNGITIKTLTVEEYVSD
jgi:hypothetical protein